MKQYLADFYKQFFGSAEYAMRKLHYPKDELVVLCMHSTPVIFLSSFERLVLFITQHFKPLSPFELEDYYAGKLNDGPYVLFTFDDGLKNNLLAASHLAEKKIRAFFFLVPAFIQSENQKAYYLKNIRPVINTDVDTTEEDFTAMNTDDLKALKNMGHHFGAHSLTHKLHRGMEGIELEREVCESKNELEQLLGISIDSFCSINHTTLSVNAKCKKLIESNYRYHFTTYPGMNRTMKDPLQIYRRNIEVHWPMGKIKFALGQADLSRWKQEIRYYHQL